MLKTCTVNPDIQKNTQPTGEKIALSPGKRIKIIRDVHRSAAEMASDCSLYTGTRSSMPLYTSTRYFVSLYTSTIIVARSFLPLYYYMLSHASCHK